MRHEPSTSLLGQVRPSALGPHLPVFQWPHDRYPESITSFLQADADFLDLQQLIAYQAVYYAAMATVKQSYLFFYLRIFPHKEFKTWVWVCMFLVFGYWAGSMLQIFLICSPFEMNWNPTVPGGHCASYNVAFTTIGCVNMVTDLIIMLLPIPFIRKLQMAIGTKIGLYVIFSIGLLYGPPLHLPPHEFWKTVN